MNQPKPQTLRDPRYLAWIRQLACESCGKPPPSEASHHGAHGTGIKAPDDVAIPRRLRDRGHGQPEEEAIMAKRSRSLAERFHEKYIPEPNSGCWLWAAMIDRHGYGRVWALGRLDGSHRVSYRLHHGPIPDGLHVCHKCDVRACVNPAHLFLGTQAENMADRNEKGRASGGSSPGEAHPMAKLTNADVTMIRRIYAAGREPQAALARQFGVSESVVSGIVHGRTWKHI